MKGGWYIKTEEEFLADYGPKWQDEVDWIAEMDGLFGMKIQNANHLQAIRRHHRNSAAFAMNVRESSHRMVFIHWNMLKFVPDKVETHTGPVWDFGVTEV